MSNVYNLNDNKKVTYNRNSSTRKQILKVPNSNDTVVKTGQDFTDIKYCFVKYFYKENINIKYKMYNMTDYDGKIDERIAQQPLHCDYGSFNVSSQTEPFITTENTPEFYELSNNKMLDLSANMGNVLNNLQLYSDHTQKIKDNTLLYYKGEFHTKSTTQWIDMSGVNDSGPEKNFLIPVFSKIGSLWNDFIR